MTDTQTQQVVDLIIQLLQVAVMAASLFLLPHVRRWLGARRDQMIAAGRESELKALDLLASMMVLAVEQELHNLTSGEKRTIAVEWLLESAAERGLELSRESAERLVEAAVRVMNGEGFEVQRRPA